MRERRDNNGKPDFREDMAGNTVPLREAQRTELDDRVARYKENPANVIPWEQVRAGLQRQY